MRDLVYFLHLIGGIALILIPVLILLNIKTKPRWLSLLSGAGAAIGWLLLLPAGDLYTTYYPATKTLILAGNWPWAHGIIMETKEHWGLLLGVVFSVAALLVLDKKYDESKKWWKLALILAIALGVLGRVIKMGAGA